MTTQTLPPSAGEAAELIDLLTRQRGLYSELSALASQQADLIAQGQTEQLLSVLSKRQGLVEELGRINDQIGPYRGRIPEIAQALPEARRDELRGLVEQVQSLLKQIIERDEQDRRDLEAAKQQVGTQISQAVRGGAALNAYKQRPASTPGARFADHNG